MRNFFFFFLVWAALALAAEFWALRRSEVPEAAGRAVLDADVLRDAEDPDVRFREAPEADLPVLLPCEAVREDAVLREAELLLEALLTELPEALPSYARLLSSAALRGAVSSGS